MQKMMEDLSQNQTELFTGLLSDSVKYLETVSVQTEAKGVFAANSEFAEAMRDRLAVASKGAYSTLKPFTGRHERCGEIINRRYVLKSPRK